MQNVFVGYNSQSSIKLGFNGSGIKPRCWAVTSFSMQLESAFSLSVAKYSGDLNTRLVWYSNGQKLSDRRMVRYSNAI